MFLTARACVDQFGVDATSRSRPDYDVALPSDSLSHEEEVLCSGVLVDIALFTCLVRSCHRNNGPIQKVMEFPLSKFRADGQELVLFATLEAESTTRHLPH